MSFIDKFRNWISVNLGGTDRQMAAITERGAEALDERAAAYRGKMYRDAGAKLDRRIAEDKKQFDEAEPLTFDGVFEEIPAPAALAAPAKPEPEEAAASAMPPQAAAPEPPVPEEEAAPAQSERRATPKAKKKPTPMKQAAEAPASAMPTEPPAPEEAAPSPKMDDAALAAAIQKQNERREAGKRKKA
jgi:hypothetical protein